jgi:2-iminoacetate synthase ThiH
MACACMTNRPARITQAEIERAIRAAKKAGLTEIEIKIGDDATIRIPISPNDTVADSGDLVL